MSGVLLPLLSKENQVGGKATVLWTSNSTILPSLTGVHAGSLSVEHDNQPPV